MSEAEALQKVAPPAPEDAAPLSGDPEHERSLFFGISASRLRSRVRWGAVLLLLSFFVPYDMIGSVPIFAWNALPEMHAAGALALLALPLAGAAMAVGLFATKRGASLAFVVLGALLAAALVRKLGADRAAWDLVRVPDAFSTRPAGAILAIALTAAATNLKFRAATRHVVPYVLGAAGVCALYFYAWPERGEAPFKTMFRLLFALPEMPDFRFQMGILLMLFLMVWPLLITLGGLSLLKTTPSKDESWFAIIANWSLTLWLVLLAARPLMMPQPGLTFMAYMLTILVVTAVIVLLSAAVTLAVESFFVKTGDEVPERSAGNFDEILAMNMDPLAGEKKEKKKVVAVGLEPKRAGIAAAIVVAILGVTQLVLARPPAKGTDWQLSETKPESDAVFGRAFERWADARWNWDMSARLSSGSEARLEVKNAGKELIEASKDLDPKLGDAVSTLVLESDDLDIGGQKWARLVHGVNDASRAAKLPYYIDPDFIMQDDKGELKYHFLANVYRIKRVNQYDVDGDDYATLIVTGMKGRGVDHLRLGFSRDEQPFALVNMGSVERNAAQLRGNAKMGYCADDIVRNSKLYKGLDQCGKLYQEFVGEDDEEIEKAVLDGTERHELQHQIDGPHLPLAGPVLNLLEGYEPASQDRVNREVSAFLAEITAPGMASKLALIQLVQYLLVNDEQRGVYDKTAVVVFEALSEKSIRRGMYVDGDKFWPVFEKLFEMSDAKLRERAKETWEELFDDDLAEPKLK